MPVSTSRRTGIVPPGVRVTSPMLPRGGTPWRWRRSRSARRRARPRRRGRAQESRRTRLSRSGLGRPSAHAHHPTSEGCAPKRTKTRSRREAAGRSPPSVRKPDAVCGSSAAEGATSPGDPGPDPPSFRLACRVRRRAAGHRRHAQARRGVRWNREVDRPDRADDAHEVGRIGDLLVAEELRPGAVGRLGEVRDRPLAPSVPARRGLPVGLREERVACVGVPEDDHDALSLPTSDAASSATAAASSSPGFQPDTSAARGDRPPSVTRGRSHHRRSPNSL